MIFGKLNLSGELTDIQHGDGTRSWPDGSADVPLAMMPADLGPYTYDAINRLAIPNTTERDNETTIKTLLQGEIADAETAYTDWASLTNAQKDAIMKRTVRDVAKLARLLLKKLDQA